MMLAQSRKIDALRAKVREWKKSLPTERSAPGVRPIAAALRLNGI